MTDGGFLHVGHRLTGSNDLGRVKCSSQWQSPHRHRVGFENKILPKLLCENSHCSTNLYQ
jgi:hypothetical protein